VIELEFCSDRTGKERLDEEEQWLEGTIGIVQEIKWV